MFDDLNAKLDRELEEFNISSEEGLAKIQQARDLLPGLYTTFVDTIGGTIGNEIDIKRLPESIRDMTSLFEKEAPSLGTLTNPMVASMVYTNLFGKFRPAIRDLNVAKKADIPCNILAMSIANSGSGKDLSFAVTILSERDATDEEIESGQVGGAHCEDGSCGCGD